MNTIKHITIIMILFVFLVTPLSTGFASKPVEPAVELIGTLDGAAYKILVPENWNGTLLVYARGFIWDGICEPRAASYAYQKGRVVDMEKVLMAEGYALAGSCYKEINGVVVEDGIQDTLALTYFFIDQVGNPNRILIYGKSMGSIIAFKLIEDYPNLYNGAFGMCNIGAGIPGFMDMVLAEALAYDVTFGWQDEWGSIGDVRDDITPEYFWGVVAPLLESQAKKKANFGLLEFFRLVNGWSYDAFYKDGFVWQMGLAIAGRSDIERRAGGPVAQNLDHIYQLNTDEIDYLVSLGVDADNLLAQMNERTNIEASIDARDYVEYYGDYTGDLTRPVITLHDSSDFAAIVSNSAAYMDTVVEAGKADMLVQAYTHNFEIKGVHCNFTPNQYLALFTAMDYWLDTADPPDVTFFPEELGFDNDYVPPPWPRP